MPAQALLLNIALLAAAGALFAHVGRIAVRRKLDGDARVASNLFATWWFALATLQGVAVLRHALALAGVVDLPLHATLTYVSLLVLCAGLWGLLYYLVYLFTGSSRWFAPVTAFYLAYYAALLYYVTLRRPVGVVVGEWSVTLDFAHETSGAADFLVMLLLAGPPFLGALGYARLFFRVEDPTQRYRIGLVSFTIAAWTASLLLAWATGANTTAWWQVASRIVSVLAALLIYAAYRPPSWVRRRWGVRAIDEPAPAG